MTLALQSLVALTLLVAGAAAALPEIWSPRTPQARPAAATTGQGSLRVVQGPADRWYVNGDPIARDALARLLSLPGAAEEVRFLPSGALSLGEVSSSLAWLRALGARPVVLQLPGTER